MQAEGNAAKLRLGVLELAEKLGNVSEACRRFGMHRSQFYKFKRRFKEFGLKGLENLPPIPKSHPKTTPAPVVSRILELSFSHPGWGCVRLTDRLRQIGISISSPTVQNILIRHGLAGRRDRWVRLEEKLAGRPLALTGEQIAFIEQQNPAFRERRKESSRPGELLCQASFSVGRLGTLGRVRLCVVLDTYSSYVFGRLRLDRRPEFAAEMLRRDVLPFYDGRGLPVATILTDDSREYCGKDGHPYERCLAERGIGHRRAQSGTLLANGFVERFWRTAGEFFRKTLGGGKPHGGTLCWAVESLQEELDRWLRPYNMERPQPGYRNMGRRPIDGINSYLASVGLAG